MRLAQDAKTEDLSVDRCSINPLEPNHGRARKQRLEIHFPHGSQHRKILQGRLICSWGVSLMMGILIGLSRRQRHQRRIQLGIRRYALLRGRFPCPHQSRKTLSSFSTHARFRCGIHIIQSLLSQRHLHPHHGHPSLCALVPLHGCQ